MNDSRWARRGPDRGELPIVPPPTAFVQKGVVMQALERLIPFIEEELSVTLSAIPFALDFHSGRATDRQYYTRHMVEAILRIRLNNALDAYCISRIASTQPGLGKILSNYLDREFAHDEILLRDLHELGITRQAVDTTRPFLATRLLMDYLHGSVERDGALPDVLWNWFVEWYSARFNLTITERASDEMGPSSVEGALKHLRIDENESHAATMAGAVALVLRTPADLDAAHSYLSAFIFLVGLYFEELYAVTIGQRQTEQVSVRRRGGWRNRS
jgi:hypothetical protein